MALKISYSGIRGLVGSDLTPAVAARFGAAFAALLQTRHPRPRVVLARDTRPSGAWLKAPAVAGLTVGGCQVLDCGILPTPTVQHALSHFQADGALMITASHNPHQWNGFKFFSGQDRRVLDGPQTEQLLALMAAVPEELEAVCLLPDAPGAEEHRNREAEDAHLAAVLGAVDAAAIRARRFAVVHDSAMGAAAHITRRLLTALGCRTGTMEVERESEPVPRNLAALCQGVRDVRADLGVAQDLDGDRLALVTGAGRALGEEYTVVLAVRHLLRRYAGQGPVVVKNTSTTALVDLVAGQAGAEVLEVPVGEVNLSNALIRLAAEGRPAFGGEGNGGVILPAVGLGRDSLIGIALILEALAFGDGSLESLVADLPAWVMMKEQVIIPDPALLPAWIANLRRDAPRARISDQDGLKLVFPDGAWCQIRGSNTEPVVRLVAEAKTSERASALLEFLRSARP